MIVIAILLEKGDFIKKLGRLYKVVEINKKEVIFTALTIREDGRLYGYGSRMTMGINSKEKIELMEDYSTKRKSKYKKHEKEI
jgi:hypothetical protein